MNTIAIKTVARDGTRRGCYPRSEAHKAKLAAANRGKRLSAETRQKLTVINREHAASPEWRQKVREGTRRNFVNNPVARKRHKRAFHKALCVRGIPNFFNGGQGAELNDLAKHYAALLCPLGYVAEHPVQVGKSRYRIDFALIEERIAIEIDGSSHRREDRRARDAKRDIVLRSLGWRVIRVKHYAR